MPPGRPGWGAVLDVGRAAAGHRVSDPARTDRARERWARWRWPGSHRRAREPVAHARGRGALGGAGAVLCGRQPCGCCRSRWTCGRWGRSDDAPASPASAGRAAWSWLSPLTQAPPRRLPRTAVHRTRWSRVDVNGAYRLSVWTDPDATDDAHRGRPVLGDHRARRARARCRPRRAPRSRSGRMALATAWIEAAAGAVDGDASRQFAALVMDHEGPFDVRVSWCRAPGAAPRSTTRVEATYDLRPAPAAARRSTCCRSCWWAFCGPSAWSCAAATGVRPA